MAVKVLIPTPLQKLTNGQAEVELEASSVQGILKELENQYSGVQERLYDETGNIRRFINIYVNGEDIRFLQGQETKIEDGATVSIIPAIAGG